MAADAPLQREHEKNLGSLRRDTPISAIQHATQLNNNRSMGNKHCQTTIQATNTVPIR
jgi:hypothetical protein